jgi:hypothetical protein
MAATAFSTLPVGEDDVDGDALQQTDGLLAVLREGDVVAGALEDAPQALPMGWLIIDNEDAGHGQVPPMMSWPTRTGA